MKALAALFGWPAVAEGGKIMPEWMYQVPTAKSVDEAVAAVGAALKDHQFSVLWDLDINQKLSEKGIEPEPPFRILEVCSAPRAKKALHTTQQVGYFLPCKIVVYEDRESHQTMIGFPKPEVLMGLVGESALEPLANEVGQLMREAITQAAG